MGAQQDRGTHRWKVGAALNALAMGKKGVGVQWGKKEWECNGLGHNGPGAQWTDPTTHRTCWSYMYVQKSSLSRGKFI